MIYGIFIRFGIVFKIVKQLKSTQKEIALKLYFLIKIVAQFLLKNLPFSFSLLTLNHNHLITLTSSLKLVTKTSLKFEFSIHENDVRHNIVIIIETTFETTLENTIFFIEKRKLKS